MFPIPFMTMLSQQKEAESRYASSMPDRSESRPDKAASPQSGRMLFARLFQRLRQAQPCNCAASAQFDGGGRTASCSECS
jgi:hypothetical protein